MAADQERAARISELKAKRPDLTWRTIANTIGVSERSAYNWKVTGGIEYENAKKLAEVFEVDPDYIWRGPANNDRAPSPFETLDVQGDLAQILADIKTQLAEQTRVLNEIRGLLGQQQETASRGAETIRGLDRAASQVLQALEALPAPKDPKAGTTAAPGSRPEVP